MKSWSSKSLYDVQLKKGMATVYYEGMTSCLDKGAHEQLVECR